MEPTQKKSKKNSKLLEQLQLLSLAESRDFKAFMRMPSNRLSERDCELGGLFMDWIKKRQDPEEAFWETALEADEIPNKKRISNRITRALDRFLGLRELEKEEGVNHLLLFNLFRQHNLGKSERYYRKQLQQHLDLGQNYQLIPPSATEYFRLIADMRVSAADTEIEPYYERLLDQLTNFYKEQRIYFLFNMTASLMVVKGMNEQTQNAKAALKAELEHSEHPVTKIYRQTYELIFNDRTENISTIIQSLGEYPTHIANEVNVFIYNYCAKKYNTGHKEFGIYLLELMEKDLENAQEKNLPFTIWSLKVLLTACILAGKADKGLRYIEQVGNKVPPIKGISTKHLLYLYRAHAHFAARRLEESHDQLRLFRQSSTYNKIVRERIESDKLLFKIYYEQGNTLHLLDLVRNTKKYVLKHNTKDLTLKQRYWGFLNCIETLCKKGASGLKKEDLSRLPVVDREWLQKVIDRDSS